MVDSRVESFTARMSELLNLEREAEMEETSNILSQYSFKVSQYPSTIPKSDILKLFGVTVRMCV